MPDTQAAYRGLKPQTALMRAAGGMSRTIDPRRPRRLTPAQQAEVDCHPEVRLLRRIRDQKRSVAGRKGTPSYDQYQRAYRAHRNSRRRREKALLVDVKERYKKEQPVIDIQRQLKGSPVAERKAIKTAEFVFVERVRAIDALFTFATSSTEEESRRRAAAIDALIALCKKQETQGFRRRKADIKVEERTSPSDFSYSNLSENIRIECQDRQCIFCLGNEDLSADDRLKTFWARGDLKKHFHRKHLRHHPDDEPIACPHPRCDITFERKMYFQNHVEEIHKIRT